MSQDTTDKSEEETENVSDSEKGTNNNPSKDNKSKGKKRPDPTRYGDWERNGRCIDF